MAVCGGGVWGLMLWGLAEASASQGRMWRSAPQLWARGAELRPADAAAQLHCASSWLDHGR